MGRQRDGLTTDRIKCRGRRQYRATRRHTHTRTGVARYQRDGTRAMNANEQLLKNTASLHLMFATSPKSAHNDQL